MGYHSKRLLNFNFETSAVLFCFCRPSVLQIICHLFGVLKGVFGDWDGDPCSILRAVVSVVFRL